MNEHYISDELYRELQMLPEEILLSTALLLREQWLNDPSNGEALMGMLITGEALRERGLELPAMVNDHRFEAAMELFFHIMSKHDPIYYH